MRIEREQNALPVRSLIVIPFASNPGYAITPLEVLFYATSLELAYGDQSLVHFAYRNFDRGTPRSLPQDFKNLIQFDIENRCIADTERMVRYVRDHALQLVLLFDVDPKHDLIGRLRRAGAGPILSYYGAPVANSTPAWKQALKRVHGMLFPTGLDGLIFESQAMADTAIHGRGVSRALISLVPLGVDTEQYRPEPSLYVNEQFDLPRDRKVVIYSGHMEQRKGVKVLLEAALELLLVRKRKDVCFLLCGNRNEEESLGYREMYRGMGLDNLIQFGGYRSDLARLFGSCFCGVIPSSGWDSFTQSSLEMASSGIPVVASRLGGLPEAVSEQETGLLFEPGNARELADCLERLLDDPAWAVELGQNGRRRCQNQFTLAIQRQRFLSCLQRHLRGYVVDCAGLKR